MGGRITCLALAGLIALALALPVDADSTSSPLPSYSHQSSTATPSQPTSIVPGPAGKVSNTNAQVASNVALNAKALPRLANIATRGRVQTGANVMIAGFTIGGTTPKKVLITARGPSVAVLPSEVPLLMADPKVTLYSGPTPVATNDDWQTLVTPPSGSPVTLLPPVDIPSTQQPGSPKDAAILTTLAPGAYTAIVEGVGGTSGLAIVEVFEVDLPEVPLINIATRGLVESGANVMIAGFIIQGDAPMKVLVTARGQSVAVLPSEVPLLMKNPMLQLYSGATPIAGNDDWQTPIPPPSGSPVVLLPATDIPLTQRPGDVKDAAILTTLAPGAYTAIVTDSTPGIAIVEVFASPLQASVLALNLANTLTLLAPGGTTTFAVTRTGMTAGGGAATGNIEVGGTGGCTLSANAVTFEDGSATPSPATVTVTAGPTIGTSCTINLTAATASLGAPASATITIANAPAPNPGTVAFNLANTLSNLAPGGTTTLSVVRTGMTAGGGTASGHLAASGGCTISADTVTFADGSGTGSPAAITVTAPSTLPSGTTCSVSLSAVGAPLGSPSTTAIIISAACTTTADLMIPWNLGQTYVGPPPNKTAAVSVTPPAAVAAGAVLGSFVVAETVFTGDEADVQFAVSHCPGDFAKTLPCAQHTQYSGGALTFSIGPKPADIPWYLQVCELPAGTTTVYLNVRQIKRPTPVPPEGPGIASCQFTSCPVFVQFN